MKTIKHEKLEKSSLSIGDIKALEKMKNFSPNINWDCRNPDDFEGYSIPPHIALSSTENWGDEIIGPDGLIEGNKPHNDFIFVEFEEMLATGPCGETILCCIKRGRKIFYEEVPDWFFFEEDEPISFYNKYPEENWKSWIK